MGESKLEIEMKAEKISAGVYRLAGNLVLVRQASRMLRLTGHNRGGNATKRCQTWKLYKTCLENHEVLEVLAVRPSGDLFGAIFLGEYDTKDEAIVTLGEAISRQANS